MKKKLAIFDLDGTLFDTSDVNFLAYRQALAQAGYQLDRTFYVEVCNGKFYKDYLPLLIENPSEELMEQIHDQKKRLYPECLHVARENKHLFGILDALRPQYYTALVTTASRDNCMDILRCFGRVDTFDCIMTNEDVTKKKPDPQGFLLAMQYFGVSPEDTIIFEDSNVGIEAGRRSGAAVFSVVAF